MTLSTDEVFGKGSPLANLIEELEAMYPHVDPTPADDWSRVLYRSGQHSVVQYLKNKLED